MLEGDKNTRFFHDLASQRQRVNTIHMVLDDNGNEIRNHKGIVNVFTTYFGTLFAYSNSGSIQAVVDSCNSQLSCDQVALLNAIYTIVMR